VKVRRVSLRVFSFSRTLKSRRICSQKKKYTTSSP
jgi:hypothetical protein